MPSYAESSPCALQNKSLNEGRTRETRLPFSQTDRERLMVAVTRIQEALTAAGVKHG